MLVLIFDGMLGNAYNFTSDTAKVLDRTEWALLSIALVVSLASLLIEARLKENVVLINSL